MLCMHIGPGCSKRLRALAARNACAPLPLEMLMRFDGKVDFSDAFLMEKSIVWRCCKGKVDLFAFLTSKSSVLVPLGVKLKFLGSL